MWSMPGLPQAPRRQPRRLRALRRPARAPAPDGTEIFETTTEGGGAIRDAVYQTATLYGEDRT